jgi:hypothetical protein
MPSGLFVSVAKFLVSTPQLLLSLPGNPVPARGACSHFWPLAYLMIRLILLAFSINSSRYA